MPQKCFVCEGYFHLCYFSFSQAPRFPMAGETIHGHKFFIGFRGIGANQCILAARIEAKTAMVCKRRHKHRNTHMFSYARPSELSVLSSSFYWATSSCVTSAGEIAIVIVAGTDLWRALSARMHAKVLVCQLEVSPHTSLQALLLAQENNVKTIFNPVPAIPDLLDRSLCFRGCVVLSAQEPSSLSIRVSTKPVTMVDVTGDGDSLICAMAFYRAHFATMPLEGQQMGRKRLIPQKDLPTDIFYRRQQLAH
uniref:Carbohydrate kinase PfkB domain-containing protein n=1 Tax=Oncorhynchus mykiss TaxID=8022 RepID=A0A8C7PAF0_ONCMY